MIMTDRKHTQELKSVLTLTELLTKKINRYHANIDLQIALFESGISIDNLKTFIDELSLVIVTDEELQEIAE